MRVMDLCANCDDEDLAAKAKKVAPWVAFMINCDSTFPGYQTYMYVTARAVTAHQSIIS